MITLSSDFVVRKYYLNAYFPAGAVLQPTLAGARAAELGRLDGAKGMPGSHAGLSEARASRAHMTPRARWVS